MSSYKPPYTITSKILKTVSELVSELNHVKKDNVPKNVPLKRLDKIVNIIKKDNNITLLELANKLGVTDKTIKRDISKLKKANKIVRVGSLKSGHWKILNET